MDKWKKRLMADISANQTRWKKSEWEKKNFKKESAKVHSEPRGREGFALQGGEVIGGDWDCQQLGRTGPKEAQWKQRKRDDRSYLLETVGRTRTDVSWEDRGKKKRKKKREREENRDGEIEKRKERRDAMWRSAKRIETESWERQVRGCPRGFLLKRRRGRWKDEEEEDEDEDDDEDDRPASSCRLNGPTLALRELHSCRVYTWWGGDCTGVGSAFHQWIMLSFMITRKCSRKYIC